MMDELTDFEILLLKGIKRGKGLWTWYKISIYIAGQYEDQHPEKFEILDSLTSREFIREVHHEGYLHRAWKITPKGIEALEKHET